MIKVGCCGYPVSREKYYKEFDCIEINSTFYQLPELKIAQKWHDESPANFEFIIKAWQLITHKTSSLTYRRLREKIPEKEKKFYGFFQNTKKVFAAWERTEKFAKTLGCKKIVFQCPSSFKPTAENISNIKNFFHKINSPKSSFLFILELRGKEWSSVLIKSICKELKLIHCTDPTRKTPLYGTLNYYRLHGTYINDRINCSYQYTDKELKYILSKCNKKLNYVMFNNITMFEDAIKFKKMIN